MKTSKRVFSGFARFVAALAAVLSAAGGEAGAQEARRETLAAPGLIAPVEIVTDRWGISHVYAENEHDLFFAQGWAAARDRLFQFELWRRRATGTVAEILGPRELERDVGARLFRFRGDMTTEMRHYHERGDTIIPAFVDGVNAWIERTEREPDLLPLEFGLLGIEPGRWTPEVVVSRHQGLVSNVTQELDNARAVAALGAEAFKELNYYVGDPDLTIDPAVDVALLDDRILDLYRAHRRPIVFEPEDVAAAHRGDRATFERLAAAQPSEIDLERNDHDAIGSNNWVVHGTRTLSGYPIMANDPHRAQSAPSLRYWVHLVAPGWNVIGGGEPVLPGVSIGHNEHGAWGLTVFGQDNEDLYVYETDPDDPGRYRHLGRWEEMTVIRETIPVRGRGGVEVELKYTRHGPVVFEDPDNHAAYAVAAAWLDYGSAPYLASLRMDQATTWEEFVEACSYSRIPSENMVWADRAGNIGYQAVGVSPIRPNHSGLVPVPGDGRYEWRGFFDMDALPEEYNPRRGFIATANANTLPPDFPIAERRVGFEWAAPWRQRRLMQVLRGAQTHTLEDSLALQRDYVSSLAQALAATLPPGTFLDGWDGSLAAESSQGAFFAVWYHRHLNPALTRWALGEQDVVTSLGSTVILELARDPQTAALVAETLDAAWAETSALLGDDPQQWRWGSLLRIAFKHPLLHLADAGLAAQMRIATFDRGGSGHTVNNNGFNPLRFKVRGGASWRMAVTPGDWDGARMTNAPGQSGDPQSPFYDNLAAGWAADESFPLLYSRAAVERHVKLRIELRPAP